MPVKKLLDRVRESHYEAVDTLANILAALVELFGPTLAYAYTCWKRTTWLERGAVGMVALLALLKVWDLAWVVNNWQAYHWTYRFDTIVSATLYPVLAVAAARHVVRAGLTRDNPNRLRDEYLALLVKHVSSALDKSPVTSGQVCVTVNGEEHRFEYIDGEWKDA